MTMGGWVQAMRMSGWGDASHLLQLPGALEPYKHTMVWNGKAVDPGQAVRYAQISDFLPYMQHAAQRYSDPAMQQAFMADIFRRHGFGQFGSPAEEAQLMVGPAVTQEAMGLMEHGRNYANIARAAGKAHGGPGQVMGEFLRSTRGDTGFMDAIMRMAGGRPYAEMPAAARGAAQQRTGTPGLPSLMPTAPKIAPPMPGAAPGPAGPAWTPPAPPAKPTPPWAPKTASDANGTGARSISPLDWGDVLPKLRELYPEVLRKAAEAIDKYPDADIWHVATEYGPVFIKYAQVFRPAAHAAACRLSGVARRPPTLNMSIA